MYEKDSFLIALLFVMKITYGQPSEFSKEYFTQKSKNQKTTAWIMKYQLKSPKDIGCPSK
jgi:hypothetical protein